MKRKLLFIAVAVALLLPMVFAAIPCSVAAATAYDNTPSVIGAQYRVAGSAGLRFCVSVGMYNDVNNNGTIERMGTLIIPSNKLAADSVLAFTESGKINGTSYLDIPAKYLHDTDGKTFLSFTAVLTDIPDDARSFTAVAYIIYKDGTVSYSMPVERSIDNVKSGSIPLYSKWTEISNTVSGEGVGKTVPDKNGNILLDSEIGVFSSTVALVYNSKVKVNGLELKLNIKNIFSGPDAVWLPAVLGATSAVSLSANKPTALVSYDVNGNGDVDSTWVNTMSGNRTGLNTNISSTASCVFTLLDNSTDYGLFGGMRSAIKVGFGESVKTAVRSSVDFTLKFKLENGVVKILINGIDSGVSFNASDVCDENGYAYLSFTNSSFGSAHYDFTIKTINGDKANEFTPQDDPKTITEAISMGLSFNAEFVNVMELGKKKVGDYTYKTTQGIATDGNYFYYIIKRASDAGSIIVKTDLNGNEIAYSKNLDLGHGNDMTYNSKTGYLVVCHGPSSKNTENGNGNGRRISFVDRNTLKVVHTVENLVPYSICGIDYDVVNNCYYTCAGNFRTFAFSDDYKCTTLLNVSRESSFIEGSDGYTYQGMGFDGKYVYFPLSGEEDNIIVVYTTNGDYVTTFHLPTAMESESIAFVNGKMYVCFNSNGAVIAEIDFTLC